jgi:hypothetical protein
MVILMNYNELSTSWEAASCAAPQELPSILWNSNVHYCVHKSPPLVPILSQIQGIRRGPRPFVTFRDKLLFYGEELLAPHPTLKLEDHPLLAVCDCLFNMSAATLHIWRPSSSSAAWGHTKPWRQGTHLTCNGDTTFMFTYETWCHAVW